MDDLYRNFYRSFYLRTGGFMPAAPLNQNVYPGDFFQIRNGEMIVLGNIFRNGLIGAADTVISGAIKLNPASWRFSDGVTKPYSGRGTGSSNIEDFEFSKQVLAFAERGSFIFSAADPEAVAIGNWSEIRQQLIIKLTQLHYSFRELYLVTESTTAAQHSLAIAGNNNAELEIATDQENFGLVDIFGHHSAKTLQSMHVEYYVRSDKRKPVFFKAKKLAVTDDQATLSLGNIAAVPTEAAQWAGGFFDYEFHNDTDFASANISGIAETAVLDLLPANALNPATALLYFKWADTNLDDIEKLFQ